METTTENWNDSWRADQAARLRETPRLIAERLDAGTLALEALSEDSTDHCQITGCDTFAHVIVSRTVTPRGFQRACALHAMHALYRLHRLG